MKVIKIELSEDIKELELHIFADEHIGDEHCDMKRLLERIEYVKNTPNAYCILNGDLLDNATKTSIGDTYSQALTPMEQLQTAVEIFGPIKERVIAIVEGNHEARTYKKEGISISHLIAQQLGLEDRYSSASVFIFLRFGKWVGQRHGRRVCYTIFALHGSGGGRREGSKANKLADLASITDADIFIHSHTHLPMVMKQGYFRVDTANSCVSHVDKLFVNTAANLNYGGYGEVQAFKPASKDTPIIILDGTKKQSKARL